MQDVEGQPSSGVGDGRLPLAERPATAGEPLQRTSQLPAQALGLEELPVVEGDAVAQPETGHEVVTVQLFGLGQQGQAFRAHLGFRVPVRFALRQEVFETDDVDQDRVVVQVHVLPVRAQPTLRAGLPQRREGPAQGGAGAALAVLGPEQAGECVPSMSSARDGQVGGQRDRLPGVDLDRHAVALDARRTEQQYPRPEQSRISQDAHDDIMPPPSQHRNDVYVIRDVRNVCYEHFSRSAHHASQPLGG